MPRNTAGRRDGRISPAKREIAGLRAAAALLVAIAALLLTGAGLPAHAGLGIRSGTATPHDGSTVGAETPLGQGDARSDTLGSHPPPPVSLAGHPGAGTLQVVLNATPKRGAAPLSVDFVASASTSAGATSFTFLWNYSDGSAVFNETVTVASGSTANSTPSHVFAAVGKFTVQLRVTDNAHEPAVFNRTTILTTTPLSLTGQLSRTVLDVGQTTNLVINISGGLPPYSTVWSVPLGAGCVRVALYLNCTPRIANESYSLRTNVTDMAANSATATFSISVGPKLVAATSSDSWFHCQGSTGVLAGNFAAVVGGGTAPVGYNWSFGDGSPNVTTLNATHNFTIGPVYVVHFTASDGVRASAVATLNFSAGFSGCGLVAPPVYSSPSLLITIGVVAFALVDIALAIVLLRPARSGPKPPKPMVPAGGVAEPPSEPSAEPTPSA